MSQQELLARVATRDAKDLCRRRNRVRFDCYDDGNEKKRREYLPTGFGRLNKYVPILLRLTDLRLNEGDAFVKDILA